MTIIGIRQLRQHASTYLRRVAQGETIQIADRGRPVALWSPVPRLSGLARLRAEGRVTDSQGDLLALGPPVKPSPGERLPSQILATLRKHER